MTVPRSAEAWAEELLPCTRADPQIGCTGSYHDEFCPALYRPAVAAGLQTLMDRIERDSALMREASDTINELDPDKAGELLIAHRLREAADEPIGGTK